MDLIVPTVPFSGIDLFGKPASYYNWLKKSQGQNLLYSADVMDFLKCVFLQLDFIKLTG